MCFFSPMYCLECRRKRYIFDDLANNFFSLRNIFNAGTWLNDDVRSYCFGAFVILVGTNMNLGGVIRIF